VDGGVGAIGKSIFRPGRKIGRKFDRVNMFEVVQRCNDNFSETSAGLHENFATKLLPHFSDTRTTA
jgi:hypothetical protein